MLERLDRVWDEGRVNEDWAAAEVHLDQAVVTAAKRGIISSRAVAADAFIGQALRDFGDDHPEEGAGFHLRALGRLAEAAQRLLARAAFYRITGSMDLALADLSEAMEIAARGPMKLHLADTCLPPRVARRASQSWAERRNAFGIKNDLKCG